jgi:hypothetical protein
MLVAMAIILRESSVRFSGFDAQVCVVGVVMAHLSIKSVSFARELIKLKGLVFFLPGV